MNTTASTRTSFQALAYSIIAGFTIAAGKRPAIFLWLAAIVIASLTGCSKENPAGPQSTTAARPGVGSTYIYKVTSPLNSSSIPLYDTLAVSRTGMKIGSKSDVVEMRRRIGNDYSYVYLRYESNGDLSKVQSGDDQLQNGDTATWVTYPVASHTTTEYAISIADSVMPAITFRSSYQGAESIKVGNTPIASEKIATRMTISFQSGDSLDIIQQVWFAPTVGCFTRMESGENHDERSELISYMLKP